MKHKFKANTAVLFTSTASGDRRRDAPAVVVRELTDDERHWEAGPMYKIAFPDGTEWEAFEDELARAL